MLQALLGDHAFFVLGAYGVSVVVLGALAAWIVLDGRALRRALDELEAKGVRRRSSGREDAP